MAMHHRSLLFGRLTPHEDALAPSPPAWVCADTHPQCAMWARRGECHANRAYMESACRLSCRRCPLTRSLAQRVAGAPAPPGCYDEEGIDCVTMKERGACDTFPAADALLRCPRTCGTCAPALSRLVRAAYGCDDAGGADCAALVGRGGCANHSVRRQCVHSCAACAEARAACARRGGGTAAVDVDALFRRVLREWAPRRPRVLSAPPGAPWLLALDEFVSDAEASALSQSCEEYTRSQVASGVSSIRTSEQCWCDTSCEENPLVAAVRERVAEVTGLPLQHQEPFQVVRYGPGQQYRTHHDQNTARWAPQGVRLLTLLIYLQQPVRGGETVFPDLNLSIAPAARSAVLWPNVLVNRSVNDGRMRHEAALVTAGQKLVANVWVHEYDFRGPRDMDCVLTSYPTQ
ncbi:hypothetical protein AB1Y20_021169 [Prymnesium parvum]|uniref:Procollagen-proline 4-dioxygenase n=1 Tax=Prymnesium parvum TaxID=97485 RepID=A0AB34JIY3_PRYPA